MKTENIAKQLIVTLVVALVVSSAIIIGWRLAFPAGDPQIGISYKYNDSGEPIRQKAVMKPRGAVSAKQYWYIRYVDRNNNGDWDKETDKLVIHLPASDPQIWNFYDHEKRGDLIRKRYCFSCRKILVPSPYKTKW